MMITIGNLKGLLDTFSDNDVVEAYEFQDDADISLQHVLGVFKGGLTWVQGKLPVANKPIGLISTILSEVTVFTEEEPDE